MDDKVKTETIAESKEQAVHYMSALIDVARESFLILGSNINVISANPIFYATFLVSKEETEDKPLYELGNGQWNIPELKKLLKEILPEKKTVKDYEVTHLFEKIGTKTMLLNASQIDSVQLIILAIEDITEKKNNEIKLAQYTTSLEAKVSDRTRELTDKIDELEKMNKLMVGRELTMVDLKNKLKEAGNIK